MPDLIRWEPLAIKHLPLFETFHCGYGPWDIEVADWITGKSEDCAAKDIRERRCKIFLYRNQVDDVIGFAALGKTNGEWPNNADPCVPVAIIPWMGLRTKFHGRPAGAGEIRYSDQIVADVVYKAKALGRKHLVLFVHPENAGAIKVYERNGFEHSDKVLEENEYRGMWMDISSLGT
jgi:GNAT superfamily N-acetyltransferase